MKKLFFALIFLPLFSLSQDIIKKPVTICNIRGGAYIVRLDRNIIEGDTLYSFIFQDQQFNYIASGKIIHMRPEQLKTFYKNVSAVLTAADGDMVKGDDYGIGRDKNQYTFYYDGGWCNLNKKDMNKLLASNSN